MSEDSWTKIKHPSTDEMLGKIADLLIENKCDQWTATHIVNIATSAGVLAQMPGGIANILGPMICVLANAYLETGNAVFSMQSCGRIALLFEGAKYAEPVGTIHRLIL